MTTHAPPTFAPGRWRARWIWAPDVPWELAGRRTVVLRHEVDLDAVPAHLWVRVCADSRYVLAVNGVEVSRGPIRGNPRRRRVDVIDLGPVLQAGTNVLTATVAWYQTPRSWWMPAPMNTSELQRGGFVMESHPDAEVTVLTDATWSVRLLEGWGDGPGDVVAGRYVEQMDLRSLPTDLDQPWPGGPAGDRPDGWVAAAEPRPFATGEPGEVPTAPTYPFGALPASPLPPRTTVPVTLTRRPAQDRDGTRAWLAPRIVVGALELDVEGPAGATVTVRMGELLVDGELREGPNQAAVGVDLVTDGTRRTIRSVDTYGLRGVQVTADDDVVVHGVTVVEQLHPVTGDASFSSADPLLDTIWSVGRRTVSICSLDAYVDCPTREQRAWTGDGVVHQMVDLTTSTDWSLARWYPELAAAPRADGMLPMAVAGDVAITDIAIIPDWALHWVHSVHNLFRWTGDADLVARLLGVAEGVLRWFEPFLGPDDLPVDVTGWVIIDWAAIHTAGVSTPLVGLLGRALQEFAEMAEWLGDGGRARWARGWHDRLATAAEALWDPQRQRYCTHAVDGERRPESSVHAQAAMIVGGLAPVDRHARLVQVMTDTDHLAHATHSHDGPADPGSELDVGGPFMYTGQPAPWWDVEAQVVAAQPFFRYVVHDALAEAGRADLVAAACRDWAAALQRCESSWTETWFGGTVSHGWSSTPTRDLMVRVLGVQPAEPGFTTAIVDPALGDLEWARGSVPTPAGLLHVDATPTQVKVDSPIPFVLDGTTHPAGSHTIDRAADPDRAARTFRHAT